MEWTDLTLSWIRASSIKFDMIKHKIRKLIKDYPKVES